MTLAPGTTRFPVYQISNPQDLSTLYYIQIVVRRASDLSLVKTLNLVSKGNGLYGGVNYIIPQDPSGQGYQLFETCTVYTDPSYTTLSPNYEVVNTPINVNYQITNPSALGGVSGDSGFDFTDYKTIRQIIAEELKIILERAPKNGEEKEESFNTVELELLISQISRQSEEHKNFMELELKTHREDIARGFESVIGMIPKIEEARKNTPVKELVSNLKNEFNIIRSNFSELTKMQKKILQEKQDMDFPEVPEKIAASLVEFKNEYQTMLSSAVSQLNEILESYFSSVDTMVVNRGVPRFDKQDQKKEKPDYLNIASGFLRKK